MRAPRASKSAYRQSDIARLIMSRVFTRSKSKRSPSFNLAAARTVLDVFGFKSVWSGAGDDLTIVRIDRTRPLSPTNAMVLQVRETNRRVPNDVLESAAAMITPRPGCDARQEEPHPKHHRQDETDDDPADAVNLCSTEQNARSGHCSQTVCEKPGRSTSPPPPASPAQDDHSRCSFVASCCEG